MRLTCLGTMCFFMIRNIDGLLCLARGPPDLLFHHVKPLHMRNECRSPCLCTIAKQGTRDYLQFQLIEEQIRPQRPRSDKHYSRMDH
ncbi:hypothetical protein ACQKWADRAFT_278751 [Trichoderma austrokoningii]